MELNTYIFQLFSFNLILHNLHHTKSGLTQHFLIMQNSRDIRQNVDMHMFYECIQQGVEYTIKQLHISRKTVHQICEIEQIQIPKRGRPAKEIQQSQVDFVLSYRESFNVGYQRMAQVSKVYTVPITKHQMVSIYKNNELFLYQKNIKKENCHKKMFTAKYVNQLWHTDIHYVTINSERHYLIGFIDDRSRFLLHFEIIPVKTSALASNALLNAIGKYSKPKMITIDNGKEFIGKLFQNVLIVYGIKCFKTHPYTPEQNGKIERFWETLEKSAKHELSGKYLEQIVSEYNSVWPHNSLHKLTGKAMTPLEAWNTMEKWNGQDDAKIEYGI